MVFVDDVKSGLCANSQQPFCLLTSQCECTLRTYALKIFSREVRSLEHSVSFTLVLLFFQFGTPAICFISLPFLLLLLLTTPEKAFEGWTPESLSSLSRKIKTPLLSAVWMQPPPPPPPPFPVPTAPSWGTKGNHLFV